MIPSAWFRRLIFGLFILEVAGALMWLAAWLVPNPADKAFAQTVAGMVFLLGFYSGAPLSARFLAPMESKDDAMRARLTGVIQELPQSGPVFLYDHDEKNATTVGILASQSRVYVTSGLMGHVSNEGLKGILAHEDTHVVEHHILITFSYACAYAMVANEVNSNKLFIFGFIAFMTLRRYLEYRADAGAARLVGKEAMVTGLRELNAIYPSKSWARWFVVVMAYPTLPMRIKALETGRKVLF
jgi:Zn-dependent protease with chaperone function